MNVISHWLQNNDSCDCHVFYFLLTAHTHSHRNKRKVKYQKKKNVDWRGQNKFWHAIQNRQKPRRPWPPQPNKSKSNIITVFFFLAFYVYSFSFFPQRIKWKTWAGCRLQRRVFVRPKTVANVSENNVPLPQQQDCIREKLIIIQNTKTKEKSTPK